MVAKKGKSPAKGKSPVKRKSPIKRSRSKSPKRKPVMCKLGFATFFKRLYPMLRKNFPAETNALLMKRAALIWRKAGNAENRAIICRKFA